MAESLDVSSYQSYIDGLVQRVKTQGLDGMDAFDVDALDEAIEMGVVREEDLRLDQDAA